MIGPQCSILIKKATKDYRAGLCLIETEIGKKIGWFFPFWNAQGYTNGRDAFVKLLVKDQTEGSTFLGYIKFLIDTGTDVTIIPRKLINYGNAFLHEKTEGWYEIHDINGGKTIGLRFNALLSIPSLGVNYPALRFGIIRVLVSDYLEQDYGLLGLDVIRKIVMITEKDHISFWHIPDCD